MGRVLWLSVLVACGVEQGEGAGEAEECARGCEEVASAPNPSPPQATQEKPSLIGRPLDTSALAGIERWYREPHADSPVDIVVFFEVWCPHCRDEMPHLTALDAMPGVEVIALTRQSRSVSDEMVRTFVDERALPFGVAKIDEQLAMELHVRGVPRAVVVKDGVIVWDGHPAQIDEERLSNWL